MEQQATQREQLNTVNQSLVFLAFIIFSILLSFWAVLIQRRQLVGTMEGTARAVECLPEIFPIRCAAGSIVLGALGFFLCLALRAWEAAAQGDDPAARHSAGVNLAASLFVFLAALLRLDDLQSTQLRENTPSADSTLPA
ncbi:hypothetical protein [Lawsonibacter celer]|uniref:hypothetical protein n=1 Tax=Lawsonibacter celer TaxID=2986526 RepID=UPI001643FF78|nr:hypothetical protein [Lawsonibacter celer]